MAVLFPGRTPLLRQADDGPAAPAAESYFHQVGFERRFRTATIAEIDPLLHFEQLQQ